MKILCLVDKYYPECSANTICADVIMNYFKAQGDSVDFLSVMDAGNSDVYSIQNDSNVIKFPTYTNIYTKKFGKVFKANKWEGFPWVFRKSVGGLYRATHFYRSNTENNPLDVVNYKSIEKSVRKIRNSYDILISVSAPFALHIIAVNLFKSGIAEKWFPIFLDPFVYNKTFKTSRIERRKKVAEKYLNYAEKIFATDGIVAENLRHGYNPDYHKKIMNITLPNLVEHKVETNKVVNKNSNKLVMVYAGLFYENIRNPKKMFEIIEKLPNGFELDIYGNGCETIVNDYLVKNGEKFKCYGRVDFSVCLQKLFNSNILVNLSNTITNQMPSKVFEYISYGKPIVNFYFNDDDVSLKYFKNYPLAFNINVNNYTDQDVQCLKEFCESNKNVKLSFNEATQNLVKYRAENICKDVYNAVSCVIKQE